MDVNDLKKDFLKYRATYSLTIITSLVWFGQFLTFGAQATNGINLFDSGALFGPAIFADPIQLWRLFTAIFIHIGWAHIVMNMLTLFFMGRMVEDILGWQRFFVIYLLSGIFGNAVTLFLSPNSLSAGASGAIFGLFGAVAGLGYFTEMPVFKQIGKTFSVMIVILLLMNFFNFQTLSFVGAGNINIWAHIGGALGGLMLSAVFPPKKLERAIPSHDRVIATVVFLGLFAIFVFLPIILH